MRFDPNNPEYGTDESGNAYAVWDDGFGNKVVKRVNDED